MLSRIGGGALLCLSFAAGIQTPTPSATIVDNARSGIRTWESGTGAAPLLLLHGYGSSPEDWLPFTRTITLSRDYRFVFPEGPETTLPPDGPVGGRAWWHLGLATYRRPSDGLPDLAQRNPVALGRSTEKVRLLMRELSDRLHYASDRQVIGGFSQGAMVTTDVALRTGEPLGALVILSGTIVNETEWLAGMRSRKGLRVFISHGRSDTTLPFDSAERLQAAMRAAGLRVTWIPFQGGHEMPAEVVRELNAFLHALPKPTSDIATRSQEP